MCFIAPFVIIEVLAYLFERIFCIIMAMRCDATDRKWFLYYNEDILMEYRIATAQDTPHVENLWAYCFEPKEDPFFQYYFTNCYEPENTMVGLEQDQLLSTVHLRQYNINVRGAVLPTSYMVGVATHPARSRGRRSRAWRISDGRSSRRGSRSAGCGR